MSLQALTLAANLLLALVLLVVGGRLLGLFKKTGQLPELILGFSCCTASAALFVMNGLALSGGDATGGDLWAVTARFLLAVSIIAIAFLAWRVFRPGSLGALATFAAFTGGLLILIFTNPRLVADVSSVDEALWWAARLSMIFSYVWAASEAFIYQSALRRRQRFGLAEKSRVPTRILLWSYALGLTAVMYAWGTVVSAARFYFRAQLPTLFMTSILGLLVSVCLWLAFFPPRGALGEDPADTNGDGETS